MIENLLEAPERGAIEALLLKVNAGIGKAPTFERILGFISGAAITPGGFTASDWLQPLFDVNGVVFSDLEDIEHFIASVMSLYDRVDAIRLRKENLCPFDLECVEVVRTPLPIIDWATGLYGAVAFQEDIWYPDDDDADWVPEKVKNDVNLNVQCLSMLVDPSTIPDTIKDPGPFQRTFLRDCPGWEVEPLRETWDEELLELFRAFCMGRLYAIIDSLQRYATAYDDDEDVVVVDVGQIMPRGDGDGRPQS